MVTCSVVAQLDFGTNGREFGLLETLCCVFWQDTLLRSAMAGRLYKLQSKPTSNSGFYQTFMPCLGYILFAAEQRVGYQISWVIYSAK